MGKTNKLFYSDPLKLLHSNKKQTQVAPDGVLYYYYRGTIKCKQNGIISQPTVARNCCCHCAKVSDVANALHSAFLEFPCFPKPLRQLDSRLGTRNKRIWHSQQSRDIFTPFGLAPASQFSIEDISLAEQMQRKGMDRFQRIRAIKSVPHLATTEKHGRISEFR